MNSLRKLIGKSSATSTQNSERTVRSSERAQCSDNTLHYGVANIDTYDASYRYPRRFERGSERTFEKVSERGSEKVSDRSTIIPIADVAFRSPLSNDDFTVLTICEKSSDEEYLHDDGLEELKDDMSKCIAWDQCSNRYLIKKIVTDQILPELMSEKDTSTYLQRCIVKYQIPNNSKVFEDNLWKILTKYIYKSKMLYNGCVFYNPTLAPEKKIFNVFYKWKYSVVPTVDKELIAPYRDFVKECIITDRELRLHFHQWVANILQHPGIRNDFGFLIIGKPATGKTTLINFIAELTKGYSKENVDDIDSVFGDFNSSRENCVFIGINDLYCSKHNQDAVWNILKSPVTEATFECREQRKDPRTVENVNNIMITTNDDFIEMEAFDRRWQVIRVPDEARNRAYFENLRAMLNNEVAMRHLYTWYMSISLDGYTPCIIKNAMSSESGYGRFVKWYVENVATLRMSSEHLSTYWCDCDDIEDDVINIRIGEMGEPMRAIYAQFKDWAIKQRINCDKIPDLTKFKKSMYRYMDVSKPNKYLTGSKRIEVIHLRYGGI